MKFLMRTLAYLLVLLLAVLAYDTALPPVSTLMVAHWVRGEKMERRFVPLSRIAPSLVRASIAAEDGKFCRHHGIDWKAMQSAVERAARDADGANGASTITMQTAKNLFLWNGRSYVRKALEAPLAMGIDAIWPKRRIMETYLNIAEFGPGIFGAEAAARHYFGVSAAGLSASQSALLAAALPSPKKRNPARPDSYMQGYASSIGARMGHADTSCLR